MRHQFIAAYALILIACLASFSVGQGQTIPPNGIYLPIVIKAALTSTPIPTTTATATRTPVATSTATATATATQVAGPCPCSANTLNCDDFDTQAEAQSCFDFCVDQSGDIHELDSDGDGEACEALPLGWQVYNSYRVQAESYLVP